MSSYVVQPERYDRSALQRGGAPIQLQIFPRDPIIAPHHRTLLFITHLTLMDHCLVAVLKYPVF